MSLTTTLKAESQGLEHSVHDGVTQGGGPSIWVERDTDSQYAGKVVDQVILKGGRWKNKTEDYIRSPVKLGLGKAAGEVEFETFREGDAVSSGWLHLVGLVWTPVNMT